MKITNATAAWANVTLAADEIWQARSGSFLVDTDSTEADREGIILNPGDSVQFSSGLTVYYRLASGNAGTLSRVVVSAA